MSEPCAVCIDRDKEIAHLKEMLRSFDPELAAFKVHRLPLDDAEEIQRRLATEGWDVALLLKFEDLDGHK